MRPVRCYPQHNKMRRHSRTTQIFDDLLDDFFGPILNQVPGENKPAGPPMLVDMYERENTIVVRAELPGIAKEDIKLDVKGKLITLGGERKKEEEVKEENYYHREIVSGTFKRTFSMPFEIEAEKVVAKYENGILELEIPKPEEQVTREIEIQ